MNDRHVKIQLLKMVIICYQDTSRQCECVLSIANGMSRACYTVTLMSVWYDSKIQNGLISQTFPGFLSALLPPLSFFTSVHLHLPSYPVIFDKNVRFCFLIFLFMMQNSFCKPFRRALVHNGFNSFWNHSSL